MIRALLIAATALALTGAAPAAPTNPRAAEKGSAVVASPSPDLGCRAGQDDRQSDLCAQWKAADAAQESARWTARSFWLALIGTLIGGGTLFAAIAAAFYARHAAREAGRSADIAGSAMVMSERAWITVELFADGDLTFDRTGGCGLYVFARIKNIGRTPALNVHTGMDMIPMEQNHTDDVAAFAAERRSRDRSHSRTLLPGDSYDRKWGLGLDDWATSPYATVIGCVTYETLPDQTLHQTAFCYIVGRGEIGTLDGNDIPKEEVHFTVTTGGFAD